MKMTSALVVAGLAFGLSTVLQGCTNEEVDQVEKAKVKAVIPAKEEETLATCKADKGFSCDGLDKQFCEEQEKRCAKRDSSNCHPKCHWSCNEPVCEKACAPKCQAPVCQTRCKGFDTKGCHMVCEKPSCAVICPKDVCHDDGCPKCTTQCGQPTCHLQCGKDLQPCHHVCTEPLCTWECKDPKSCPKPQCHMECEEPDNCLDPSDRHSELPPLSPGETQVANFQASHKKAGLSSLRVNVTTMGLDNSLHGREVELPLADADAEKSTSKRVTDANGMVVRHTASCRGGNFQCQGDDKVWCAAQQSIVCKSSPKVGDRAFMQQRARTQRHLRP